MIHCLQGRKDRNIEWLELVGGVRRDMAGPDIILKTKLQNFLAFVRREAVGNQNARVSVRTIFGLGIKHKLQPL